MNQVGNSSTYVTNKAGQNKKFHKFDKKKFKKNVKKFPELSKMGSGNEHRNSNYTMSSEDEIFNVSSSFRFVNIIFIVEVPTNQAYQQTYK